MFEVIPLMILLGVFSGLMAGLLGIGGGLIIVPALILVFEYLNFNPVYLTQMAVASSLAIIVFTSLSSIRTHHLAGMVDWHIVKFLSVGIAAGALLGAFVATELSGVWLQGLLGVFAIVVAAQMGFELKPKVRRVLPSKGGLGGFGLIIGTLSTIFGIGGGSLTVPLLTWFDQDMKRVIATSAACGLPIAVFGVAGFLLKACYSPDVWSQMPVWSTAYFYWPAIVGVSISSVVTAHFGAKLAHILPAAKLKKIFAGFLFIIGARFIVIAL